MDGPRTYCQQVSLLQSRNPKTDLPWPHPPTSMSHGTRPRQWTACPSAAERTRGEPGSHVEAPLPGARTEHFTSVCMRVVIRVSKHPAGHAGWRAVAPEGKGAPGTVAPLQEEPGGETKGKEESTQMGCEVGGQGPLSPLHKEADRPSGLCTPHSSEQPAISWLSQSRMTLAV